MCPSFPFDFEGGMWDLFVLVPDPCLSIYLASYEFSALLYSSHGETNIEEE